MVLQSSGAISLGNIQTEFGGSNPIALSEYYASGSYVPAGARGINGLIPTSSSLSFSKFYGYLDTQVVTVGYRAVYGGYPTYGVENIFGYETGVIGSVSDGTSNIFSGASIAALVHSQSSTDQQSLFFLLSGTHSNAGWTTMNIAGTDYSRSAAGFAYFSGYTQWSWIAFDLSNPNPFGTTVNDTKIVTWI